MKKLFLLALISTVSYAVSYSQTIVRGKVSDENGEAVIGAPVVLKSNRTIGIITDINGAYSLNLTDTSAQILIVSYMGYKTVEVPFTPVKDKAVIKDVALVLANVLEEVEIVAKTVKSKDNYMERRQVNAPNSLNYISAETIKRTGDATVTAAVARVSGVSTNNGGLITVRGIGDRYVKTTVNGSRIPTLDPFTNNIRLDMFPGSLVDNIIITKTATPDLPGDWAGAYLSIETKDYPDNLTVDVETTVGYNSQSTFKDMLTSQHSPTDWLGYDNGFRDRKHDQKGVYVSNPTDYQKFAALGYADYFNSLGVTEKTSWTDTYTKLGLEKLGLLQKGQFNDVDAFKKAKLIFDHGPYQNQIYNSLNAHAARLGQSMPNNWNLLTKKAPLNFTQSFSMGNQAKLFGRPLGFLFGFRYSSANQSDPNSVYNRPQAQMLSSGITEIPKLQEFKQNVGTESNGWSALVNMAYSFNPNHSLSLLFMPNLTGVNQVRYDEGYIETITYKNIINQDQFYEQRKQLVYQLKTEHYLPGPKLKIDLNGSYTNGNSSAPDFKTLSYGAVTGSTQYVFDASQMPPTRRNYRYLTENLFDCRLAAELPLFNKPGLSRKIKFGGAYQSLFREADQYIYKLISASETQIANNDIEAYFSLDKFGFENGSIKRYYERWELPAHSNFGYSKITSGFVMLDYAIIPALRFSGGLRVEETAILTDVREYHTKQLPVDDERRKPEDEPLINPGMLNELTYLPSANVIYKLKQDELAPVNLRLSYSKTLARPSIRELSETRVYDYELRTLVMGKADLKMVHIQNYDLRLESYFKSGDNVSLSLFYKAFKNHIELISVAESYTWVNIEKAKVLGIELEGKKALAKSLELRANVSLIHSRAGISESRSMFGQAPYVINGILSYTPDKWGLAVALSYNLQGPRLVIATTQVPGTADTDVYELPRHLFDFKIAKSLGRHFNVSLKIRDILNTAIRRAYKYEKGSGLSLDYDSYRFGTSYVLGLSYKL